MPRLKAKNLAITTLAQELPSNADSCVVTNADVLPDAPFRAVIGSGDNFEIVEVTAKDGNTLTLLRGLEGTTAQTWAAGTRLVNRLTAGYWDEVCRLIQLTSAELLTISSDTITISQSFHLVDTEGGASLDNLSTINGGNEGDLLFLRAASSSRTVVLKHGLGNIRIPSGQDFPLDSVDKAVLLLYDGENWLLVGAAGGLSGSGTPGYLAKWVSETEVGSSSITEAQVDDAISKAHDRAHSVVSSADHPDWPAGVSLIELGYLDGVTGPIQTQLDGKVANAGATPSIQAGLDANRPAAGTEGRLYIATDTQRIYRDSGTSWVLVGVVQWADVDNKPSTFPPSTHGNEAHSPSFLPLSGGTMQGILTAQNNTNYSTFQVRNVVLSTNDPSGGGNGDIWMKYEA